MRKFYALPGASFFQVDGEMPDGWVEMRSERPTLDHVATAEGSWVEAPPAVPLVVSRFQGREAMHQTPHGGGSLFDAAEAVLARPDTPAVYRRAWNDLQEFRRDSEMLAAIAAMLDLSEAEIDALFILAASIKA